MTTVRMGMVGLCLLGLVACNPPKDVAKKEILLNSDATRIGYAIGFGIGKNLKEAPAGLDMEAVLQGVRDGWEGKTPAIPEQEMDELRMKLRTQSVSEGQKEEAAKNLKEGAAFMEANRQKEGVTVTPSGLQIRVIKEGAGEMPKATDTVQVHYRGTLIDGKEFDSSYARNQPATFPLNGVIPGWTEGLQLMHVGSTCQLVIPPQLAYRERGIPNAIPPNATLVFEVELLGIEAGNAKP